MSFHGYNANAINRSAQLSNPLVTSSISPDHPSHLSVKAQVTFDASLRYKKRELNEETVDMPTIGCEIF